MDLLMKMDKAHLLKILPLLFTPVEEIIILYTNVSNRDKS